MNVDDYLKRPSYRPQYTSIASKTLHECRKSSSSLLKLMYLFEAYSNPNSGGIRNINTCNRAKVNQSGIRISDCLGIKILSREFWSMKVSR